MAISPDEVSRIAKLAKLEYSEEEKHKLTKELSDILNYVDQLKSVQDKADQGQLFDDPDAVNLMRDDVAEQVIPSGTFLAAAPDKEGDFFKVKSVLE